MWYNFAMNSVIGHEKILNYFSKVVETGNLSHAYILSGPEHLGKKFVAENISAKLFGISLEKVEDVFGDKVDHIASREKLMKEIDIWQSVLRGLLHSNNNLLEAKLKLKVGDGPILKIMNKLKEARLQLENNIHPRILIEQMLLEMP